MCILAYENVELLLEVLNRKSKLYCLFEKVSFGWNIFDFLNKCLQCFVPSLLLEKSPRLCMHFTHFPASEHPNSLFCLLKINVFFLGL